MHKLTGPAAPSILVIVGVPAHARWATWSGIKDRELWPALVGLLLIGSAVPAAVEARYHHHHGQQLFRHPRDLAGPGGEGEDYYTATSGHRVHRPVRAASAPVGASARCRDDSWSFSENHRGICSHHGGVARWL